MSTNLGDLCDKKWVGCYHSPYNKDLASNYLNNIRNSGSKLKKIFNDIIKEQTQI